MYTALYYPHTRIEDRGILKAALLLWDSIEFIAPWPDFRARSEDSEVQAALDLIARPYYPSNHERKITHDLVLDLVTSPLPTSFLLKSAAEEDLYPIFPQKFLPETWHALSETKLAIPKTVGEYEDWVTSKNLGLAIMSLLAEACAGTEKRTVTDRVKSYSLLMQSLAHIHGGEYGKVSNDVERLVTISVKMIDPGGFSLDRLIDFRERESDDPSFRVLRHNYLNRVDAFIERIRENHGHSGAIREIERQFEQEMQDDLRDLKDALRLKAINTVLSKEVGVGILAAAGMSVSPIALPSTILGVGALLTTAANYSEARKEALRKHAMAWLFASYRKRRRFLWF